jgi:hypothetical protein
MNPQQILNPSIFNPEIACYLEINGFLKIDDGTEKDMMHWQKKETRIEFNSNEISVFALVENEEPLLTYYLHGFSPSDCVLFTFLMHSWQIILLQNGVKLITDNYLSNSLNSINYN